DEGRQIVLGEVIPDVGPRDGFAKFEDQERGAGDADGGLWNPDVLLEDPLGRRFRRAGDREQVHGVALLLPKAVDRFHPLDDFGLLEARLVELLREEIVPERTRRGVLTPGLHASFLLSRGFGPTKKDGLAMADQIRDGLRLVRCRGGATGRAAGRAAQRRRGGLCRGGVRGGGGAGPG